MSQIQSPHPNTPPSPSREVRSFVVLLTAVALYLAWRILGPFAQPVVLAAVLASLFSGLEARLETALKGRRNVASALVVLVAAFAIVIPALLFLSAMINEGVDSITAIRDWLRTGGLEQLMAHPWVHEASAWIHEHVRTISGADINLRDQLLRVSQTSAQGLLDGGANLIGNVATVALQFAIMLFVMFFFVRDGREMIVWIRKLSPLSDLQEDRIFGKVGAVARSVIVGNLLTGVIQGVLGGIGLAIVGIPALFWGALMGLASLIPVVGTGLIWAPAAIYLFITGDWRMGLFLTGWCVVLLGIVDNFVRPFLMRGPGGMSALYVFLALLGGVRAFGFAGLLYGPLILGFAAVALFTYDEVLHRRITLDLGLDRDLNARP